MLLGQRLPGAYRGWRVVEKDLYDIAARLREYDPDARLVREDGSGHLGLAVRRKTVLRGDHIAFARRMHDLDTDLPLSGCPDGRVLRFARGADSRRITNWAEWWRQMYAAEARAEALREKAWADTDGDHAEHMVHSFGKDSTHKPRAFIGAGL